MGSSVSTREDTTSIGLRLGAAHSKNISELVSGGDQQVAFKFHTDEPSLSPSFASELADLIQKELLGLLIGHDFQLAAASLSVSLTILHNEDSGTTSWLGLVTCADLRRVPIDVLQSSLSQIFKNKLPSTTTQESCWQFVKNMSNPEIVVKPQMKVQELAETLKAASFELDALQEDGFELVAVRHARETVSSALDWWGWHGFLLLRLRVPGCQNEFFGRFDWGYDGARVRCKPVEDLVWTDRGYGQEHHRAYVRLFDPENGIKRLKTEIRRIINASMEYSIIDFNCGHFANRMMNAALGLEDPAVLRERFDKHGLDLKNLVHHDVKEVRAGSDLCFLKVLLRKDSANVILLTIDLHRSSRFLHVEEVPIGYSMDSGIKIPLNSKSVLKFYNILCDAARSGEWQALPVVLQNLVPARMLQGEGDSTVDPYIKWTDIATGGCIESMKSNVALREVVPQIDQICADIKSKILQVRSTSVNQQLQHAGIGDDELAGIIGYSHDLLLPNNEKSGNLYYECNNALRVKGTEARKKMIRTWGSYMHWTMKGLEKLPSFAGIVVRGIPGKSTLVTDYTKDLRVQWKAFSSGSKNLAAALAFFDDPADGVIFRVTVKTGKAISALSFFPSEDEVLLLPGKQYTVKREAYQENGHTYIDMEENDDVGLVF